MGYLALPLWYVLGHDVGRVDEDVIDVLAAQHAQHPLVQVHDGHVAAAVPVHDHVVMHAHDQEALLRLVLHIPQLAKKKGRRQAGRGRKWSGQGREVR